MTPIIVMAHDFAANLFKSDVAKISEADARKLATAWCNWRQYYAPLADSKSLALGALIVTAFTVEMPRITVLMMQSRMRQAAAAKARAEQAEMKRQSAGRVVPMEGFKGI